MPKRAYKPDTNIYARASKGRRTESIFKTKMSIQLTQLLELSNDLSLGRKRRLNWESEAEKGSRQSAESRADTLAKTAPLKDDAASCFVESSDIVADIAEMKFLSASLAANGLTPRSPDAENAMLQLLSADARSAQAPVASLGGAGFEWMADLSRENVDAILDVLKEPAGKTKKTSRPDREQVFARVLCAKYDDDHAATCIPSDFGLNSSSTEDTPLGLSDVAGDAAERDAHCVVDRAKHDFMLDDLALVLQTEAIERLRALLRMPGVQATLATQCAQRGAESSDDGEEEASELSLVEDMSREAMEEVERQELAQLLVCTALDVALETHLTV